MNLYLAHCSDCEGVPNKSWFISTINLNERTDWLEKHEGHNYSYWMKVVE